MRQFATFRLGDRMFGIDVRIIREINRILDITPLPFSADYVRGLINLRGQIVTILDLGLRLGLPRRGTGPGSHNIILKRTSELVALPGAPGGVPDTTSEDPVGFLVDAIGDVVDVEESGIEPSPPMSARPRGTFFPA